MILEFLISDGSTMLIDRARDNLTDDEITCVIDFVNEEALRHCVGKQIVSYRYFEES